MNVARVATGYPFTPTLGAARSIMLGGTDQTVLAVGLGLLATLAVITYTLAVRRYVAATTPD